MAQLKNRLQTVATRPLSGTFWRMVPASRNKETLSTQGSLLFGGRYNPQGDFGALYLSESKQLCLAERTKAAGGNLRNLKPHVLAEIDVSLTTVIDLTDQATLDHLGIDRDDLVDPTDYTLTQAIAALAREAGIDGLIVPCAVESGKNLIVFDPHNKQITLKSVTNWP